MFTKTFDILVSPSYLQKHSILAKFFYFIDLKEDEKCFPCILIKGDVDKNGTDQCVHNSNLFEFEGFSTPDLIKNLGKSDEDKEKDKKEK